METQLVQRCFIYASSVIHFLLVRRALLYEIYWLIPERPGPVVYLCDGVWALERKGRLDTIIVAAPLSGKPILKHYCNPKPAFGDTTSPAMFHLCQLSHSFFISTAGFTIRDIYHSRVLVELINIGAEQRHNIGWTGHHHKRINSEGSFGDTTQRYVFGSSWGVQRIMPAINNVSMK